MRLRQEVLEYNNWFKINTTLDELNESMEEYNQRQEYILDIITAHALLNEDVDWESFNKHSNESLLEFRVRIVKMHHTEPESSQSVYSSLIDFNSNHNSNPPF